MEKNCIVCNKSMKLVQAGISKKTNRPYKAFFSCSCGQTAPAYTNSPVKPQTPQNSPNLANNDAFKEELRTRLGNIEGLVVKIALRGGMTQEEVDAMML